MTWSPEWEICEDSQCAFSGFNRSTSVILQRCKTEDGNWLYMAVSSGDVVDEGGIALAIEHVTPHPGEAE